MNAIDQEKEVDPGAAYGATSIILCAHPHCNEVFEVGHGKKYHSTDCKNDHHVIIRELGWRESTRGTIRAAKLENSEDRLIPIAKILSTGKEYTPMEIDKILREQNIYCYHITTAIQELKKNGLEIVKRHIKKQTYAYRLVGGQTQLLRIVK